MNVEPYKEQFKEDLDNLDKRQQACTHEESQVAADSAECRDTRDRRYLLGVRSSDVVVEHTQIDRGLRQLGRHSGRKLGYDVCVRAQILLIVLGRVARTRRRHLDRLGVAFEWTLLVCARV